ncbi:MAG: FHA domain-containing protein [Planctomycetaceae bacterium]|nr:FHA domain-containing protein [Planctomycetaceae bacterium]
MGEVAHDSLRHNPSKPIHWQLQFASPHGGTVFSIVIDSARFRVGRRENADFVLASPQISGFHTEFVVVGMRLFVRDLASTNGTYLNGKRIGYRDVALRHGDRVRMANVEFLVHRERFACPAEDTAVMQDSPTTNGLDQVPVCDPASVFTEA